MNKTDDAAFLHTFTILLLGLTAVGILAFILAGYVARHAESVQPTAISEIERTKPEGKINIRGNTLQVVSIGGFDPAKIDQKQTSLDVSESPIQAPTQQVKKAVEKSGEEVYDQACSLCHMTGVAGAPRFGDKKAWSNRISKGLEPLYANAINGYVGNAGVMPAKGGRPDLTDKEVRGAVDYIINSFNN